jgi:hypothetical protein
MMAAPRWRVLLLSLASAAGILADEHVVAPRGEYARIDVALANETIVPRRFTASAASPPRGTRRDARPPLYFFAADGLRKAGTMG